MRFGPESLSDRQRLVFRPPVINLGLRLATWTVRQDGFRMDLFLKCPSFLIHLSLWSFPQSRMQREGKRSSTATLLSVPNPLCALTLKATFVLSYALCYTHGPSHCLLITSTRVLRITRLYGFSSISSSWYFSGCWEWQVEQLKWNSWFPMTYILLGTQSPVVLKSHVRVAIHFLC